MSRFCKINQSRGYLIVNKVELSTIPLLTQFIVVRKGENSYEFYEGFTSSGSQKSTCTFTYSIPE